MSKKKTSKKTNGKGVGVRILCGVLALVVAAGATLAVLEYATPYKPSQGFRPKEEPPKQEETEIPAFAGGMFVTSTAGDGFDLLSAQIPVAAYAENGLVGYADNAYTITATVKPDNYATNTGVEWVLSWANPESEWATGKTVTDYVTATPSGAGYMESKVVNLTCAAAFGEQVLLTAKAQEKPEVTAVATVDYVQRLEAKNVALSFGEIECNFSGNARTLVPLQLSAYGDAAGGMPEITITQPDEPYTIEGDYQYTYDLYCGDGEYFAYSQNAHGSESRYIFADESSSLISRLGVDIETYINQYNVAEKGLYFGMKHFIENMPIYSYSNVMSNETLTRLTLDKIQNYAIGITNWFEHRGTSVDETQTTYDAKSILFRLTFYISGPFGKFGKATRFDIGSIVNTTNSIDDIELNPPSTTI